MDSRVGSSERLFGRSLWWMWPARVAGRIRPGLARATDADALALGQWNARLVGGLIPVAAVLIALVPSVIHAMTQPPLSVAEVDYFRIRIDDLYTESLPLMTAAMLLGAFSPALGAFFVLIFGALDLIAASRSVDELLPLGPALIARGIAYWLLWLLAVEIPVFARSLAESDDGGRRARLQGTVVGSLAFGLAVFIWTLATPTLIRPASEWTYVGRPLIAGIFPLQNAGWLLAIIGGVAAALVVAARGPHALLGRQRSASELWNRREVAIARHVAIAALLTVALAGVISNWLEAAVLFAALVAARPVAVVVMERTGLARLTSRAPTAVRLLAAAAAAFGVALLVVPRLYTPSDVFFTSVVVGFVPALFAFELVAAERRASTSGAGEGLTASPVVAGIFGGLLVVAVSLLLPVVVLADNCSDAGDCYGLGAGAAFAAAGGAAMMGGRSKPKPRDDDFIRKKLDYINSQIQKHPDNPYWKRQQKYWSSPSADTPQSDKKPPSSTAFPSSGAATKA